MTIREEVTDEEAEIAVDAEKELPDAFYCPITKDIMKDPVVDAVGDSFEKTAVMERDSSATYYPNRALKAIITKAVQRRDDAGSVRGALRRWDESIRSGWQQLLEKSALPSPEFRPLPDVLYCIITGEIMHVPVIDPDGNSYEKVAIENWVRLNACSPLTRNPVALSDLRPNNAIHDLLDEEKEKSEESVHPSIRRWRDLPPPEPIAPSAPVEPNSGTQGSPTQTQAQTFPTTPAQLEERRRQAGRKQACTIIAFGLVLFIFVGVVPYFMILIFVGGLLFILAGHNWGEGNSQ